MQTWNEVLAFCITSAIGCMDEPPIYGPLRLVDCMERLLRFGQENGLTDNDALSEIAQYIEENKLSCMYDEAAFRQVLQEAAFRLMAAMEL